MALIRCMECGNNVSERAQACLYCGCPVLDTIEYTKGLYLKHNRISCGREIYFILYSDNTIDGIGYFDDWHKDMSGWSDILSFAQGDGFIAGLKKMVLLLQ